MAVIPGSPNPDLERGAFVDFPNGTIQIIPNLPGANHLYANAINESDVICGYSFSSITGVPYSAFRWQNGQTVALNLPPFPNTVANDIADDGSICGYMGDGFSGHGFIWKDGKTLDIGFVGPGAVASVIYGINNHQAVCGASGFPNPDGPNPYREGACFWKNGRGVELATPPGFITSRALALNDSDVVVGYGEINAGGQGRGLVWQNGIVRVLNDLIPTGLHIDIQFARAINNAGQIAGSARVLPIQGPPTGDTVAVRLTPIPPKTGDVDCNWTVDIDDLVGVITRWGETGPPGSIPADLDLNGTVNLSDLVIVLMNWD